MSMEGYFAEWILWRGLQKILEKSLISLRIDAKYKKIKDYKKS